MTTTENTTTDEIVIENHVKVYLERAVGGAWRVARCSVDGCPLDGSDNGDYTDLDPGCLPESVTRDMNSVGLPDAAQLLDLLAEAVEFATD